jgi:hypothetical protein
MIWSIALPNLSATHTGGLKVNLANLVTVLFTSVRIEADCIGWP